MTAKFAPLLFPEILATERVDQLTAGHGLTQADLDWLRHASLPSHTQRTAKTPPMFAGTILLQAEKKSPIALAGCFVLSASPDNSDADNRPAFLYTPMGGIKKFDNRSSLETEIDQMRQDSGQRDDLFSLLSISQRGELNSTTDITQTRQVIHGDIFKSQLASIEYAQNLNAASMVNELIKLPSLRSMLERILSEKLQTFDYRQARVALGKGVRSGGAEDIGVTESMPLIDAILTYFHHQGWPLGHYIYITYPGTVSSPYTVNQWQSVITETAVKLIPALTTYIDAFWEDMSTSFYMSRRKLLSQVIRSRLWASLLIEREKGQLTQTQYNELTRMFKPSSENKTPLSIEAIRLWEYEPNYVELAGSLMISGKAHYLYTPTQGLRKVASYLAFKELLLNEPTRIAAKEAVYRLLDLEESNRFLRYDEPNLSGKPLELPIADSLANTIIDKQKKNLHYALEMSRQVDVDIHALVDKALDVRAFIDKNLSNQPTAGHWGSQPAFYGNLRPSNFRADQLRRKARTCFDIAKTFNDLFTQSSRSGRSTSLLNRARELQGNLTHVFSLGIRTEAELRALEGTLPSLAHELIETVFAHNSDYPDRSQRIGVRGFRPDVYSLNLTCSEDGQTVQLPVANCFFLTERGGLDTPLSGMGILWTPAGGLQVYPSAEVATRQLNKYLLDARTRFGLLANLPPAQRKPHARYQLQGFELIEDNVLLDRVNSFIKYYEAEHGYLTTLKRGSWQLTGTALTKSIEALVTKGAPSNLERAARIAQSDRLRLKLPAWLGTAALEEQRLHVELIEQCKNSVVEGKDYLDGIESLRTFVQKKLQAILNKRFAKNSLNPETIQITPALAIVGPARALTDFALCHADVTDNPFTVSSTSTQPLPDGLDEMAVRQMLSTLDITTTYKQHLTQALSGPLEAVQLRKQYFRRQLPWQLLHYAHTRHLQQELSATAFDLIRQVLDMPDAIARQAVKNATAIIRPLELIKTDAAAVVKALGLYVINSSTDAATPHILYSPYHDGHELLEFKDEASMVAAFNTPGALQDLLIRRLPENQQATFRNLLASTLGKSSEITLASNPITTNVLDSFYDDNASLLTGMLSARTRKEHHFDWGTVVHVLDAGAQFVGKQLPSKLKFIQTLWESYQDFKDSSEALQDGDWKAGLHNFIAGAAEMVSLGFLNRDDTFGLLDPIEPTASTAIAAPASDWKKISSTSAIRTDLQVFEATDVSLANLTHLSDDTYKAAGNGRLYVPVGGKVYQVAKDKEAWRIVRGHNEGPLLRRVSDSRSWEFDPQHQTIRFGGAGSKIAVSYSDLKARGSLNIEARGMTEIRRKYPERANMIVQALETARHYSSNTLQNLDQLKTRQRAIRGSQLDIFLRSYFGVSVVDSRLIAKIEAAISPICTALADPLWEQQNGHRITVGHLRYLEDRATAFVFQPSAARRIYLTQFFFDFGLDWYKSVVPDSFNVDAHAQAATFIHELSHQLYDTLDFAYLDSPLPFLDLISTVTHQGKSQHARLEHLQRHGLSLTTPKSQLFTQRDSTDNTYKGLEHIPQAKDLREEILKITGTRTMDQARDAFLNATSPDKRIDVILRNADSLTLLVTVLGRQLLPSVAG